MPGERAGRVAQLGLGSAMKAAILQTDGVGQVLPEHGGAEGGSGSVERHQHGSTSGTSPKGGARSLEEQTRPVEGDSFPLRQACSERPRLHRVPALPGVRTVPRD